MSRKHWLTSRQQWHNWQRRRRQQVRSRIQIPVVHNQRDLVGHATQDRRSKRVVDDRAVDEVDIDPVSTVVADIHRVAWNSRSRSIDRQSTVASTSTEVGSHVVHGDLDAIQAIVADICETSDEHHPIMSVLQVDVDAISSVALDFARSLQRNERQVRDIRQVNSNSVTTASVKCSGQSDNGLQRLVHTDVDCTGRIAVQRAWTSHQQIADGTGRWRALNGTGGDKVQAESTIILC